MPLPGEGLGGSGAGASFPLSDRDVRRTFARDGDEEGTILAEEVLATLLLERARLGVFGEDGGSGRLAGFAGFLNVGVGIFLSFERVR